MANPVTVLLAASTALNATSAFAQGATDKKAADYEADQMQDAAKAAEARGTRVAYERRRQGDKLMSDARAAMAAGGGSTTDAGMVKRLGDIEAETDYNVLASLYEGQDEARGIRNKAQARQWEGKLAKRKGVVKSVSSILRGGSDIYSGYSTNG